MTIARLAGFPDGNGHGWNLRKVAVTATVTALSGLLAVSAARAAWTQLLSAVETTASVYSLPAVVLGPAGKPELGLTRRMEAVELKVGRPGPTADEFAEAVVRAMEKRQRRTLGAKQPMEGR